MSLWKRVRWEIDKAQLHFRLAESRRQTQHLSKERLILFFVPEAWVVAHFALLSVLAKTLTERGHQAAMVRCFDLFDRCPAKDMRNMPLTPTPKMHEQVCIHCAKSSFSMTDSYGLRTIDLRAYDTPSIRRTVSEELRDLPTSFIHYEFDGVAIGRICANQVALIRKAYFLDAPSPESQTIWKAYIQTALMTYLLMKECLEHHDVPVMVHYNDYISSIAARVAVRQRGGKTICVGSAMHKNVDRTRPIFHQNLGGAWLSEQYRSWGQWKDLPLLPFFVREIGDDSLNNFRSHGIHIFSPNKNYFEGDIRSSLGIDPHRKLVVAFTSSTDEMLSMKHLMLALNEPFLEPPQPFEDQIQWISHLMEFVRQRSDIQLWVRIHPREGSNERNRLDSEHLGELRRHFGGKNTPIRFVWPEEKLSSYDLAEAADLCLISWSTIGLEMARVGVPVIATTNNEIAPIPQGGFLQWESSQGNYWKLIDDNLKRTTTSLQTVICAFRWYYTSRLGHSIDISDVIPHHDFVNQPAFRIPSHAQDIEQVVVHNTPILDINRAREPKATPQSVREEKEAVRKQLRRFFHYLATGEDKTPDEINARAEGGFLIYRDQNRERRKYSRMATRILDILNNE